MSPDNSHRNALKPGYELHWYRLQKILGQGGFGITYLARDLNLDEDVAIKEYLPVEFAVRDDDCSVHPVSGKQADSYTAGLGRFIAEARTLARFRHPNIVRVRSVFEDNNTAYMVMDCEHGQSLQDMLAGRETLDESRVLDIVQPVMDGLQLVHAAGFIHRDIKPANIFIRADQTPVLLDFGSARYAMGEETRTLTSLVSPGYAPYEQYYSGGDEQGPWTDIYGIAATMYRAIIGRAPLDAVDRSKAILNTGRDTFVSMQELAGERYSERFLAAIDHGLRFKPQDRPRSLSDWQQEFGASTESRTSAIMDAPTFAAAEPRVGEAATAIRSAADVDERRKRTLTYTLTGLFVAALVSGAIFWGMHDGIVSTGELTQTEQHPAASEAKGPPAVPSIRRKSIAVLAFDDLSPKGDQEWFSEGLSEELINSLTQLPQIRVAARTASFQFKDTQTTLPDIGRALNVGYLVEGSVRRAGDQFRITAQLVRAGDGFQLWSNSYDGTSADVFKVQQNVANDIAGALNVVLDDRNRSAMNTFGTRSVIAYEAYLHGIKLFHDVHDESISTANLDTGALWRADEWFDKAIKADPRFVAPHFLRADAFTHFVMNEDVVGAPPDLTVTKALETARQTYEQAAELASDEPSKLLFRIHAAYYGKEWQTVSRLLRDVDFNKAEYKSLTSLDDLMEIQIAFGRAGDALNILDAIMKVNPLDKVVKTIVIHGLRATQGPAKALAYIRHEQKALGDPDAFKPREIMVLEELGRFDEALAAASTLPPTGLAGVLRSWALAMAGRRDEANAMLDAIIKSGVSHIALTSPLIALGRRAEAEKLVRAIDKSPAGPIILSRAVVLGGGGKLQFDPSWTPNFTRLLKSAGVRLESNELPTSTRIAGDRSL